MATILDELVIHLGLDSRSFNRDVSTTQTSLQKVGSAARKEGSALEEVLIKTQTETGKRMRQVEEVGRSAAQGFTRLRNEVIGLLGAIAGATGLAQFTRNVTTANTEIGYMAKTIGIPVEELDKWDQAGKRVGASSLEVAGSMKAMAAEIQNAAMYGKSEMMPFLRNLESMPGRSLELIDPITKKARDVTDIFMGLQERFSKMRFPEALAMGKNLNLSEGTVRLLSMSTEELTKLLAQMKGYGLTSDADVKAAQALTNSWYNLEQAATKLGNAIVTGLNKNLVGALNAMTDWVVASKTWLPQEVLDRFNEFITVLGKIGAGIKSVVDFMGGWQIAAEAMFALWVAAKLAPLLTFATTFAAMLWSAAGATLALNSRLAVLAIPAWFATLLRLAPALLLTGPAGGEDDEFSRLKNEEFKREHPESSPIGKWFRRQLGLESGEPSGSATPQRKADVRDLLANDLGITGAAASGIVSSLDAESGIRGINEVNPVVPGSRGGFGWAQWTGSRRDDFEAWAARNGITDLSSDAANVGFLKYELNQQKYAGILAQLKRGDITPSESADIVARKYIIPPSDKIPGHTAGAEAISKLPSSTIRIPPTGPVFGAPLPPRSALDPGMRPQMPPQSALDPGMQFALRSQAATSVDNSRSNTSSSETHIGNITVNTQASDADGIARGIGASLKKFSYVPQGNYGLA